MMSQVSKLLSSLVGKPVWGARRTHGSAFFIEIGSPHLEIREALSDPDVRARSSRLAKRTIRPVGEYQFLILDCNWIITSDSDKVTNEFNTKDIDAAMDHLNGTYIAGFDEDDLPHSKVALRFDNGATLAIEPYDEAEPDDQWNIRVPDGAVWALRPDGSIKK